MDRQKECLIIFASGVISKIIETASLSVPGSNDAIIVNAGGNI